MKTFDEIILELTQQFRQAGIVEPDVIPNIDLYMDQVTTFMNTALRRYKRNDNDKILTKTMINNYAKAKIFPSPIKKKYSKMHIMLLIMIYHLKSVLSIADIGTLFYPILAEKTKEGQEALVLDVYTRFVALQKVIQKEMNADDEELLRRNEAEKEIINSCKNETAKRILFVLQLSIRAYAKKQIAERVLDYYFQK